MKDLKKYLKEQEGGDKPFSARIIVRDVNFDKDSDQFIHVSELLDSAEEDISFTRVPETHDMIDIATTIDDIIEFSDRVLEGLRDEYHVTVVKTNLK